MKRPVGPLHAKELLLAHFFLETSLTPKRDAILVDAELDVALFYFGELRLQDETLVGLVEIHRRRPGSGRRKLSLGVASREGLVDDAVHPLLERQELTHRIPVSKWHLCSNSASVSTRGCRVLTAGMLVALLASVKQINLSRLC